MEGGDASLDSVKTPPPLWVWTDQRFVDNTSLCSLIHVSNGEWDLTPDPLSEFGLSSDSHLIWRPSREKETW